MRTQRYQNEYDGWENQDTDYHYHSRDNWSYSSVNYCSNCGAPINNPANTDNTGRRYNRDEKRYKQKYQNRSSCSSVLVLIAVIIAFIIIIASCNVGSSSAHSDLPTGQDTNIKYNHNATSPGSESVSYHPTEAMPSVGINQAFTSTPRTYMVKPGDTLYRIAVEMLGNGSRWTEIDRLNNLERLSNGSVLIHPGQVLILPDQ